MGARRTRKRRDLQVTAISLSDVGLNIVCVKAREEDGVHTLVGSDQVRSKGVLVRVGESDGGGPGRIRVLRRLQSEGWEGLEWKGRVSRVEGCDELRCKRIDVVEVEWGVEGLGEGRLLKSSTDIGGVTGLNSQDGTGNSEVALVNDCSRSSWILLIWIEYQRWRGTYQGRPRHQPPRAPRREQRTKQDRSKERSM